MPTVEASALIDASLAEAWEAYFDPRGWPDWVDAFADVIATDGYPLAGGTLVWRTGAAGRGEITEEVIGHEPRTRHRIRFQDPTMRGELETRFALEGPRTRISQSMSYSLAEPGVFAFLGALFVRSQVRRSIERSLEAFRSYAGERPPR